MIELHSDKPALRPLDLLLIEDNPADAELCLRELKRAGFEPRADLVQTAHEFCAQVSAKPYQIIIADYALPAWGGAEALELLQQMDRDIPFILLSGTLREEEAAECLQKGATDYVDKDRLGRLGVAVRHALERKFLRDERARLEARFRDSEQRHQRLAELSPDPLFIQSDDQLVFVNAAAAKLLGADAPARLLGKPALSILHPDSRAALNEQHDKLDGGQASALFDGKLLRLDGKSVDVKIAATSLNYHDRPAVQFIARDVSERKRVEQAIESLAAFPRLNPNPVLEFARDGKLTYFNDAARDMARLLGKDHPSGMLPPDAGSLVQTCLATGQNKLRHETSLSGRTLSWSFFPIKQNQVVHCYVGDVTERETLEAQLRHSQKLESVGRLAAGVAHDFNNILTVIAGHTGLLRSDPGVTPLMSESLQQISRAAERGTKLTGQLLTFSRKNALQPRRLDLNEVLTNISLMLHRTLGEDINFQFNYASELPPVFADGGMMEQVIMNLAVNARDAMPKGGQLLIATSVAEVSPAHVARYPNDARPGKFVCLTFIDTGCGMDHVTLGRIFEPFFTTKEFGKGTGLGLATVYGIVKQHQGWIEVQSQVGQGTTFRLYLPPSAEGADKPAERTDSGPLRGGKETVLVVEDEPPVRWIVKDVLERQGYRVIEAGNGVEALAAWHRHQNEISLLLTDVVMPSGLSGQELAEKFQSQKPGLRVIYTSGYSVQVAGKGLQVMDGLNFLQKPFDANRLARSVRQCLDS